MNNVPMPVKTPLLDTVKLMLPYMFAMSLALNVVFGVALYKIGSAIKAIGSVGKSAASFVDDHPVIERSTELENCKITVTKYQAAQQQGGRIYWGSKIDSCGPATPASP